MGLARRASIGDQAPADWRMVHAHPEGCGVAGVAWSLAHHGPCASALGFISRSAHFQNSYFRHQKNGNTNGRNPTSHSSVCKVSSARQVHGWAAAGLCNLSPHQKSPARRASRARRAERTARSCVRLAPHVVDAHDPFVRACPASVIADLLQNTGGTRPAPVHSAGCLLQPSLATSAAPVPHAAARRRSLVVVARRPARVAPSHARVAPSHAVAPAARVWFGVDLPR